MKFLLIMNVNPQILDALTDEEKDEITNGHAAFMDTIKASGEMLGTIALADPSQSATVKASGGVPAVTDGPFAEAKEFLGGYYLVEVADRERALELAKMIPDTKIEGLAVEVRPVVFSADPAGTEAS
ncbi:MAG TPA: YciI family protein [Streptosporangiales bacterium]